MGASAMPAGARLEAARERVVQSFVGVRTGRERLRLDHLERREQVGLLVVLRRGLIHALRIRRGSPDPADPHGRWNGSAYSRSGTRNP